MIYQEPVLLMYSYHKQNIVSELDFYRVPYTYRFLPNSAKLRKWVYSLFHWGPWAAFNCRNMNSNFRYWNLDSICLLNPSAISRLWHKTNFWEEYSQFEYRVLLLLNQIQRERLSYHPSNIYHLYIENFLEWKLNFVIFSFFFFYSYYKKWDKELISNQNKK